MSFRCPGLSAAGISAKMYPCPACGAPVEMFSDEHSVRCPQCKTRIEKDPMASCKAWCNACTQPSGADEQKDTQKEA